MIKRLLLSFIFILSIFTPFLLSSRPAFADVYIPPGHKFKLIYTIQGKIELLDGEMIMCSDKSCNFFNKTAMRKEGFFFDGLTCQHDSCVFRGNGLFNYYKLRLNFSDKIRESNVFTMKQAVAPSYFSPKGENFEVKITNDNLIVQDTDASSFFLKGLLIEENFLKSLIITLLLEFLFVLIFLKDLKQNKKFLFSVLIVNFFSLTIIYFIFPFLESKFYFFENNQGGQSNIISEIIFFLLYCPMMLKFLTIFVPKIVLIEFFAIVFEAISLYFLNKKEKILSFKKAVSLSFLMNFFSFSIGTFLYYFLQRILP